MIINLVVIGFISILGQVIVLRELNVAFFGVELIYILAIGIWLFWTAIGALVGRRNYLPDKKKIHILLLLFALLLPIDIIMIRAIPIIFSGIPGTYLSFGKQLSAITFVLMPVGLFLGLLFQWAAKLYIRNNKTLAIAYAIESIGGFAGGLAATLFLQFGVQNFTIAIICSILSVIPLFPQYVKNNQISDSANTFRFFIFTISIFLLGMLIFSTRIDHKLTKWIHPNLIESCDSPYGRITITENSEQYVVFENNILGFETESIQAEEFVHIAALQRPVPEKVLILGGGFEGLLTEILKHSPKQIDYVELNPVLLEMIKTHLPELFQHISHLEHVQIFVDDPRRFLKSAPIYDLIIVGMPEPASGQTNRFYTVEFFEQCAAQLTNDGVLALRLASSENLQTHLMTYRITAIYRALASVFNDVVIIPGTSNLLIASNTALPGDSDYLDQQLVLRQISTKYLTSALIDYRYTNDRMPQLLSLIDRTNVEPNSDTRPVCYLFSSLIWLMKFYPQITGWDIPFLHKLGEFSYSSYFLIGFGFLGLFLIIRQSRKYRRIFLTAVAGFMGMVYESLLILHYQVKCGVLYQNIGILLMMFMIGLSAGSATIHKFSFSEIKPTKKIIRILGYCMLGDFVLINFFFIWGIQANFLNNLIWIGFLMFAVGFLVSGLFAWVSLVDREKQTEVVSPLYAADLIGGCLGSLLGSLILIPFLGLDITAILLIILSLTAFILV